MKHIILYVYIHIIYSTYIYIPRTQMTSIFEGQPSKTRAFPIKTRVIWVPGIYISIYIYIHIVFSSSNHRDLSRCPPKKKETCPTVERMVGKKNKQLLRKFNIPRVHPPNITTRWWIQMFFIFTFTWGNDPI